MYRLKKKHWLRSTHLLHCFSLRSLQWLRKFVTHLQPNPELWVMTLYASTRMHHIYFESATSTLLSYLDTTAFPLKKWVLFGTSAPVFKIKLNVFLDTLVQNLFFLDNENK